MGLKATETACNIKNVFGLQLLTNVQCSGCTRSFAKEMRALKMRSVVAGHWKFTMTNWEQSSKLMLLQWHEKLRKSSTSTILHLINTWSKLERWKALISGCLMSWLQIKKKILVLKCHLLLVHTTTTNHFSIRLRHVTKSGFYTTTSSVVGWRRNSKALSKANPAPKKGHGHCVVVCCASDPL